MTALPETGRPSISRWRPRRLTGDGESFATAEEPLRRFLDLAAAAGPSQEAKPSTRDVSGESAIRAKSPSIVGSASGRSQEMRICGSLRSISDARSSLALVRASSVSSSRRGASRSCGRQMKDGGDGREQHGRRMARPATLASPKPCRTPAGPARERLRGVLGARQRARKQVKREAPPRPPRAIKASRPPAVPGAPPR